MRNGHHCYAEVLSRLNGEKVGSHLQAVFISCITNGYSQTKPALQQITILDSRLASHRKFISLIQGKNMDFLSIISLFGY